MTNIKIGDVDIDIKDRNKLLEHLDYIPASKSDGTKHTTGIYVQDVEVNPATGYAAINFHHHEAIKFDLLHLTTLDYFTSNQEVYDMANKEPNWNLFKEEYIVKQLPHIHNHFRLVNKISPKSVADLVLILEKIREKSDYHFRKSHAYAYALNIVSVINIIEREIT